MRSLLCVLATTTSAVALAQTSPTPPNDADAATSDIIVTAQKRSERLQEVPVAVTALPGENLATNNQTRIQDFAQSVPGFTISPSPSAGGQQMLAIRGISTGFNTNPTVGVVVDDIPYGSSTNLVGNVVPDIDPSDLARIEVLRGPQGTLYGASSMGGLLKFVSIDPSTSQFSGRLSGGIVGVKNGAELGYSLRGAINVSLSSSLAIRASGFTRQDPGYIDNPVLGTRGVNEAHASGGRASLLFRPSENLSIKLGAYYQHFKGDGTNDVNILPGLGDLQQNYVRGIGAFSRTTQVYNAAINANLGDVALVSLTGYNINHFKDSFDFSYALGGLAQSLFGVSGAPVFSEAKVKKFTQEVRATIPIGERISWLVGGFYTDEKAPASQEVFAADPATGRIAGSILFLPVPQTYSEYAGFTDLTVTLSDQFDVQVGARESHIKRTALGQPDVSSNAFTYLATARYRPSRETMIYLRAASGYRAGGANVNPDPTVPKSYAPDKVQNYELGFKGTLLDRLLSYDVSLYYIDWKGLQLNLLAASNNQTYTTNVSRAKSEGVEVSLEARPARDTSIKAWGSYSNAVLTRNTGSAVAFGVKGDRLPYGARWSGRASIDQEFDLATAMRGHVGATLSYTGKRIGTFTSSAARETYSAFTTVDLRAGIKYQDWSLDVFANNVGDKRGVLGGGLGTFPPFAFSYIQPRTVGVSLARNF